MEKIPRSKIKQMEYSEDIGLTTQFSLDELNAGIKVLNNGKAIGLDGIFMEEIKHFGPLVKIRLLNLFNCCMAKKNIPKLWLKTCVIANCGKTETKSTAAVAFLK